MAWVQNLMIKLPLNRLYESYYEFHSMITIVWVLKSKFSKRILNALLNPFLSDSTFSTTNCTNNERDIQYIEFNKNKKTLAKRCQVNRIGCNTPFFLVKKPYGYLSCFRSLEIRIFDLVPGNQGNTNNIFEFFFIRKTKIHKHPRILQQQKKHTQTFSMKQFHWD